MAPFPCSRAVTASFFLVSAIPIALIIGLERTKLATRSFEYESRGWLRESAKWDEAKGRFIVSLFEGGLGEIPVPTASKPGTSVLEERPLVRDPDIGSGNSSLGLLLDPPRNRVLVAVADVAGGSFAALACYDMSNWKRVFLTRLAGPGDEKSLADDVAVDGEGNAYVTDAKASRIWKVGSGGELVKEIRSSMFRPKKQWYRNLVGLNGIVHHPDGFLLTVHTSTGTLLKISGLGDHDDAETVEEVRFVDGRGLAFGDGIALLSPTRLVVAAAAPSGRLVESRDGWRTARVVGTYVGPLHRLATSVTVKDGKPVLSHLLGGGFPRRKHLLVEAVFSPF
ncbi:hypothetical protein H6P81_002382 [Aristolochia fimbriata]|uniref:Uncharacterized protein n=1 Tax=Aristolochia fimbriata TaxID=158543 RepID=A0AAV7FA64_ARIFI|nr:hypothetical protein H6P81_002382 [Aristolochia fimbriata]